MYRWQLDLRTGERLEDQALPQMGLSMAPQMGGMALAQALAPRPPIFTGLSQVKNACLALRAEQSSFCLNSSIWRSRLLSVFALAIPMEYKCCGMEESDIRDFAWDSFLGL